MLIAVQELLDSPNEKDPANGPPNQMYAAALRFHAVGPAELRSRLCRPGSAVCLPRCAAWLYLLCGLQFCVRGLAGT